MYIRETSTSSNVPLANKTVDVIPSSLQQLLDSSFASAAAGRGDANFDDAPTPNRDSDPHKTWYSDSRHQGASAVQISASSDVPKRVDSRFRRRRRTAVVPPTSRACWSRTLHSSFVKTLYKLVYDLNYMHTKFYRHRVTTTAAVNFFLGVLEPPPPPTPSRANWRRTSYSSSVKS